MRRSPPSSSFLHAVARAALLAGAASVLLGGLPLPGARFARTCAAEDQPAPAPVPEAPKHRALDAKEKATLAALFHAYLEVSDPVGFPKARIQLLLELKRLKETGADPLADLDGLTTMIYTARPYEAIFEKKILPKDAKDAEVSIDAGTAIVNVVWDQIRCSISLPTGYVDAAKGKKLPTMQPFPTIVTLHEIDDFQDAKGTKKFPGLEVLKRRYDRKTFKAITDTWILLAPVATRARFIEDDGKPNLDRLRIPLSELWKRYDVDFQHVVLDGGSDALAIAASQAPFFAGLVVRGDNATLKTPELARNFAHVPVYVVGTEDGATAKGLLAGGFPKDHLTVGAAEGLVEWLTKLPRRVIPKSFHWLVKDPDYHGQALWVNLEAFDLVAAAMPNLDVECVDTKEDPNTVRIRAEGIRGLSIFLSDALVDLDRPVRVVVNGTEVAEARVPSNLPNGKVVKLPMKFDRTLDETFDRQLLPIRKGLFYGWLYPVLLQAIAVRSDAKEKGTAGGGEPPAAPGAPVDAAAKERAERDAAQYFSKAEENEKAGDLPKALKLYKKAAEEGDTSVRAKAEAKVKELEAKVGVQKIVGPGAQR